MQSLLRGRARVAEHTLRLSRADDDLLYPSMGIEYQIPMGLSALVSRLHRISASG